MAKKGRILSINISGLRDITFGGQTITTGFFKQPVQGSVQVRELGIVGDAQGDLTVHGGLDKAVYIYPNEHYAAWERLLDRGVLPPGSFGENVTSEGLLENDVHVGDLVKVGTTILQVRQPRSPCYKLQIRFERPDMAALFVQQGKPGWYASVIESGSFAAGDDMEIISRAPEAISIADIWRYGLGARADQDMRRRVMELGHLPSFWKQRIIRPE